MRSRVLTQVRSLLPHSYTGFLTFIQGGQREPGSGSLTAAHLQQSHHTGKELVTTVIHGCSITHAKGAKRTWLRKPDCSTCAAESLRSKVLVTTVIHGVPVTHAKGVKGDLVEETLTAAHVQQSHYAGNAPLLPE